MFRGIVFGQGEVAEILEFPEDFNAESLFKDDTKMLDAFVSLRENVIHNLKNSDEFYFEKFKQVMTSKNHYLIEDKLLSVNQDVLSVCSRMVQSETKVDAVPQEHIDKVKSDISSGKGIKEIQQGLLQMIVNKEDAGVAGSVFVYTNAIAITEFIAAAIVAVVIVAVGVVRTPHSKDLNTEKLIDNIVTHM